MNAEAGGKMFRVTDCVMTVKNGQMTAAVTLSGRGYNRIYLGDVNNASDDEKELDPSGFASCRAVYISDSGRETG